MSSDYGIYVLKLGPADKAALKLIAERHKESEQDACQRTIEEYIKSEVLRLNIQFEEKLCATPCVKAFIPLSLVR